MQFALIISVVTLAIGSQAAPQFNGLNLQLADLLQNTRNRLQDTLSQVISPLQRNNYHQQIDAMLGQAYRLDNNHVRQSNQAIQEQLTHNQWSNLSPMYCQMNWINQNPFHTNGRNPTSLFDANNLNQRPMNGGWGIQCSHGPPPPYHRPGQMSPQPHSPPPPPPPPSSQNHHHHHHHRPGPPLQRPHQHQPNRDESGPANPQQSTTVSVSQPELLQTSTTARSTTETLIRDSGNPAIVTEGVTEDSVSATTPFDWNNYYPTASPDNPGGAGLLDLRILSST